MCEIENCLNHHDKQPLPYVTQQQRRDFLLGLASLPLAVVLAHTDLREAAASTLSEHVIDAANGTMGYIAMPKQKAHGALLLIHEWWGLNDSIKAVANDFAQQGYIAFAIDLYGGKVGTTPDEARALIKAMDPQLVTKQLVSAMDWLRNHPHSNGKIGTIGWCFGGGWSLNASIAAPSDASVIYYGRVTRKANDLKKMKGPILGHFATLDQSINQNMVSAFESELKLADKSDYTHHWYDANHAFANPSSSRYDADDAALAWQRTTAFFDRYVKKG